MENTWMNDNWDRNLYLNTLISEFSVRPGGKRHKEELTMIPYAYCCHPRYTGDLASGATLCLFGFGICKVNHRNGHY